MIVKINNSLDKKFLDEIMREYDFIRARNKRKLEERKKKLYKEHDDLRIIKEKMNELEIKIARLVLYENNSELILKLKNESFELSQKHDNVLKKLCLPKNYFEIYDCVLCHDTGFIGSKRCDCFKRKLAERYCELSNLNSIFEHENFDKFDFKYYEGNSYELIKEVYKASLRFVKNFGVEFKNLFFCGDTGLGKTFLCNCIAKEILNKGKTVLYNTAPELFKMLEEIRFNSDEKSVEREKMIFGCDLLIIDDLGAEFMTDPTHSDLFNIINLRILNKKPVIISSNIKAEELPSFYTQRIVSRIYGYYDIFEFEGQDIRIKKRM